MAYRRVELASEKQTGRALMAQGQLEMRLEHILTVVVYGKARFGVCSMRTHRKPPVASCPVSSEALVLEARQQFQKVLTFLPGERVHVLEIREMCVRAASPVGSAAHATVVAKLNDDRLGRALDAFLDQRYAIQAAATVHALGLADLSLTPGQYVSQCLLAAPPPLTG